MAATPNDIDLELEQALKNSLLTEEKEANEFADLDLALALSASEEENRIKLREQETKRLQEREAEEKATQEFLTKERLRNAQKQAEEEATRIFLMREKLEEKLQEKNNQYVASGPIQHPKPPAIVQGPYDHVAIAQQLEFLKTLEPIMVSPAVAGEYPNGGAGLPVAALTDAHKFTCTLIREGIPKLRAIDDILRPINQTNLDMPTPAVLADILASLKHNQSFSAADIANITVSLNNVIAAANPIDLAETQAHVPQLLSRVWTLAKRLGRAYTSAVATALSDNIADQGGCIPGLVARLYPIYAKMIQHTLERSLEAVPNLSIHI